MDDDAQSPADTGSVRRQQQHGGACNGGQARQQARRSPAVLRLGPGLPRGRTSFAPSSEHKPCRCAMQQHSCQQLLVPALTAAAHLCRGWQEHADVHMRSVQLRCSRHATQRRGLMRSATCRTTLEQRAQEKAAPLKAQQPSSQDAGAKGSRAGSTLKAQQPSSQGAGAP